MISIPQGINKLIGNNDARLMLRLNGQRHEGPNWKPRITIVDSCVDLGGSRQHGVASNEVISWSTDHPYPLNGDGVDLRRNSNPNLCRLANMQNAWQRTTGKIQTSCCCRDKKTVDKQKLSRRQNHGQAMLKMSSISDLKIITAPKILDGLNTMMQTTANDECV